MEHKVIPTIVSAGIDALTFTMENHTDEAKWLHSFVMREIHNESEAGNDVHEVRQHGFNGLQCGHYRCGDNGKRLLFETTGGPADAVAELVKDCAFRIKTTRIDWQVSFKQEEKAATYTQRLRGAVKRATMGTGKNLPGHTKLYESVCGADSFYIHTGDKTVTHRTYNKSAQSPDSWPAMTWRHELQLRHERAGDSFRMFRSSTSSEWLARSHIIGFLKPYGIAEPWMLDTTPCRPRKGIDPTDTERRIAWFNKTALPVLMKLAASNVDVIELLSSLQEQGYCRLSYCDKKALNPRRSI